jgi:hypothetical protein
MHVGAAARARIANGARREVHAWIVGTLAVRRGWLGVGQQHAGVDEVVAGQPVLIGVDVRCAQDSEG